MVVVVPQNNDGTTNLYLHLCSCFPASIYNLFKLVSISKLVRDNITTSTSKSFQIQQ